jgi:signal transduction histidine kinase
MGAGAGRLQGGGPQAAARQAAVLFALSGVLALLVAPAQPSGNAALLGIGAADLAVAAAAWTLPWSRWNPRWTAVLAVPALAVLSASTWAFGGFAAGTGPFYVMVFAWLGLHHSARVVAMAVPVGAVAYLVPLVATGAPPAVLVSAVVLVPVATAMGLLVSAQVRRLNEARDAIARMEQWRAALTATLAHDVRSPLATIAGALELIGSHPDLDPQRRKVLTDASLRQTRRLSRLATSLLDLERVEQGKLRLDYHDVAVATAVDSVAELLGNPHLSNEVDPVLTVPADPERLEQILLNVTSNAVRHGQPPIHVRARQDGQAANASVVIEVRDHGSGVPDDSRGTLFERLAAQDSDPDSVGLGLWIARLLVEAHGGTIAYEAGDPGARFVISLPAAAPLAPDMR